MNNCSKDCDVQFSCSRATNADSGLMKTIETTKRVVLAALFIMLPWSNYAAAEQFPGVQEQLDWLVNADALVGSSATTASSMALYATASFEAPAQEVIPGQAEMIVSEGARLDVSAGSENAQSGTINQELASLDVVDTGEFKQIQSAQPASITSRDKDSLEVVDTGVSRHVQNPQPAAVMSPDAEVPVTLESTGNASTSYETDEVISDAASGDDQRAISYEHKLPLIDVADKKVMTGTVVAAAGTEYGQPEDISGGVVSNKVIDLPYAVLLIILALMSMIPIARR